MNRKRIGFIAAIFVLTFAMTSCGTQLYEMTDEEQQLIVDYSAHVLAKYNIYQSDGMTSASLQEETEPADDTVTEDTESGDEKTNAVQTDDKSGQASVSDDTAVPSVSIAKAIGYDNLAVTYGGITESPTYKEGNYYSMEAGSGNKYAIMKFTISNTTGADAEVDLFNNGRTYTARFADGKDYPAEGTFLTYSLTTYQGTLNAAGSVDVVLLFKIPADALCDNASLYVFKDNVKNLVEL